VDAGQEELAKPSAIFLSSFRFPEISF